MKPFNQPQEIDPFTRLYNIGLVLGSAFTIQEALWLLYQQCSHLIDTTNFAIALYHQPTDSLHFGLLFQQDKQQESFEMAWVPRGLISHVVATQNSLFIQDLSQLDRVVLETSHLTKDAPPQNWLGVPIPNLLQPIGYAQGAIVVWNEQAHHFTNRDRKLLSAIASQSAVAIRYVQMLEGLQHRALEIAVINDVAHTLTASLNLSEVLRQIMEQIENLFQIQAGVLLLKSQVTSDLICRMAVGPKAKQVQSFAVPLHHSLAGRVAQTNQPVIIIEATEKQQLFVELQHQLGIVAQNIICVPLTVRDQVIGVLELFNKRGHPFKERDLELLKAITPYAAVAIENAQLHEKVLAEKDRVIEAGEIARRELARNLHDGPTQLVSDILMRLNFCEEALKRNEMSLIAEEVAYMRGVAERAIHQMRTTLFELRPLVLEMEGVATALAVFLERRQKEVNHCKLIFKLKSHNPDGHISRQEAKVEAAIFAIVQEALNNALKHAQAKNIIVQLTEAPEAFYVMVADDGKGFDLSAVMGNYSHRTSLGMINIRERAELIGSELQIKSAPGMGTHIFVYIPKTPQDREQKRRELAAFAALWV